MRKQLPCFKEFFFRDFGETYLVEMTQKPWMPSLERRRLPKTVPHLYGAAKKLITTRPFHAIDAHIRPTDADRILRRPWPRRIVFRCYEAMARIVRRCNRRAEIHIPQTQDDIGCIENNPLHIIDGRKPVYTADEFDIVRAPRCIGPRGFLVFAHRQTNL